MLSQNVVKGSSLTHLSGSSARRHREEGGRPISIGFGCSATASNSPKQGLERLEQCEEQCPCQWHTTSTATYHQNKSRSSSRPGRTSTTASWKPNARSFASRRSSCPRSCKRASSRRRRTSRNHSTRRPTSCWRYRYPRTCTRIRKSRQRKCRRSNRDSHNNHRCERRKCQRRSRRSNTQSRQSKCWWSSTSHHQRRWSRKWQ